MNPVLKKILSRSRIDWKYALSLELTDEGFDFSVLSEFRQRLVEHAAAERLLNTMLDQFMQAGLLSSGGTQRTDSTNVLAQVRDLNRLELAGRTLQATLDAISNGLERNMFLRFPALSGQWSVVSGQFMFRQGRERKPGGPNLRRMQF